MSATKFSLSGSVGQGGANRPDDTKVVQHLINLAKIRMNDYPLITVDGKSGNETIGAIRQFQQRMFGASDGRVDIGGRSIDALLKIHAEEPLRNPKKYSRPRPPFLKIGQRPHEVEIGEDGRIVVKPNDWVSKYSAAMYGHFVGIYEFGRLGPTGMVVLENKDLIRAGEVLYHWPTYNAFMGAKLKIPIVKERKATPEEEKAITEHAIKHELEPHGRHAHKVMDKISEIVGYAGPVVEISALVFAALEPVATALGILASPFLFYDMVMDHLNNRDMNLVIYSVRAMGYATATWAFDLSPVTSSPVVLARLAGPNKAVAANLDKAWKISYDQMLRELPKMAWSFFHAKGDLGMTQHQTELAFKQVLRGAGNDSPADVAEKMMKALALKYIRQGMPRDAFMKGLSVKFPR